jgi:hypothetical protein
MHINKFHTYAKRNTLLLLAGVLALAGLMPYLLSGRANAAQLTNRSITINSSEPSATNVTYDVSFRPTVTTAILGISVQFCTSPLLDTACTEPTGMGGTPLDAATITVSQTGATPASVVFDVDDTDSDDSASYVLLTHATGFTAPVTSAQMTFSFTTVTNPSTVGAFYARFATYSSVVNAQTFDGSAGTIGTEIDEGAVALSTADQLTVTGRVQERLDFCVSAVADDDGADTTVNGLDNVAGCTALSDTSVDIGVIDPSTVSLAPVPTGGTTQGEDTLGIAMISTNGSLGTALTYVVDPVVAGSTALAGETHQEAGFRIYGSTIDCNAAEATFTDQCFQSAADTGEGTVVSPGVNSEWFGVYVPCVDTGEGDSATPMTVDDVYDGADESTTNADDCENEDKNDIDANNSQNLAWNATNYSATADTVATSTGVLDDVIVKLAFGAIAENTTPTGTYTVVTTWIATPVF